MEVRWHNQPEAKSHIKPSMYSATIKLSTLMYTLQLYKLSIILKVLYGYMSNCVLAWHLKQTRIGRLCYFCLFSNLQFTNPPWSHLHPIVDPTWITPPWAKRGTRRSLQQPKFWELNDRVQDNRLSVQEFGLILTLKDADFRRDINKTDLYYYMYMYMYM